jgi:hypothetical protein
MRSGSNIVPELCCIALFGESRVVGFDKENPLKYRQFDSHLSDITGSELLKPDRPVQSGFVQEPGKCETLMWLSAQAALREEIFRPSRPMPCSLIHFISIFRPIPILIGSNAFFYIGPSPPGCTVSGNVSLLRLHSWLPRYPRPYGTIGTIEPFF